jgi:phytoene synthase
MDDAAAGRCYLPADWLAEAGVPPGAVGEPAQRAAVSGVVRRLLAEADRYYASATEGLRALPFRSAWAVATALGVYREIGDIVRARGPRAWEQRAVVSRTRKAWHGVVGCLRALRARRLKNSRADLPRDDSLWKMPGLSAED